MSDLAKFCEARSDQLNNVDLIAGNRIIKITKVKVTATGKQDVIISYEGDNGKPWKPCKTMARIMMEAWSDDIQKWVGKSVELFRDPNQTFGPHIVGGTRIRALSGIDADFTTQVIVTRGQVKPVKIFKLVVVEARVDAPLSDLTEAGKDASSKGTEAYKSWFTTLTPTEKKTIEAQHAEWKVAAGKVDEGAQSA